jgi:hypothetical protein
VKSGQVCQWLIVLAVVMVAVPGAAASAPPGSADSAESGGVESLHNSYVYFNPSAGGDGCFARNLTQTFCVSAISYTTDWEYVYYLWMRFPVDWTINNVYLQGTPSCVNGGSFGSFSWWGPSANEVRITHTRYHANPSDTCAAYYCFQVTSGSSSPGSNLALASWYWSGTDDFAPPYHPCSFDGYTPSGQDACDEAIWAQAAIPSCPRIYLPLVLRGY